MHIGEETEKGIDFPKRVGVETPGEVEVTGEPIEVPEEQPAVSPEGEPIVWPFQPAPVEEPAIAWPFEPMRREINSGGFRG